VKEHAQWRGRTFRASGGILGSPRSGQPEAIGGRARIPAARARWHPCRTMTDYFRELDHRSNDRIDVRLLWRERDDRVIVTVADGKTGERFTVDVTEGESAFDVFHHPFAYAA
jgi:hypothetical protein